MTECDHFIGIYFEGAFPIHIYKSETCDVELDPGYGVVFDYCPFCGERLTDE